MTFYDVVIVSQLSAGVGHLTELSALYKEIKGELGLGQGLMSEENARLVLNKLRQTYSSSSFDLRIQPYGHDPK